MIAENLASIRTRIAASAGAAGRDPSSIRLIAVSKTMTASAVREAYAAGQRDFGENYAQELRDKARELEDLVDLRWHFIGRLQRNKAKYVTMADRVHAIDAVDQAVALAERKPGVAVLVAVAIGQEATKGGVSPEQALDLCQQLRDVPVVLKGLMCLPPWGDDPEASAPFFARLATLAAEGRARGLPLDELSMGMSHDFEVAIRHGATFVRVGTAIFGSRS